MRWVIAVAILLAIPFMAAKLAIGLFRAGSREEYLSGFPVVSALAYTLLPVAVVAIASWLENDFEFELIELLLWIQGTLLIIGSAIWLVGFFLGRWRSKRSVGVIQGSR